MTFLPDLWFSYIKPHSSKLTCSVDPIMTWPNTLMSMTIPPMHNSLVNGISCSDDMFSQVPDQIGPLYYVVNVFLPYSENSRSFVNGKVVFRDDNSMNVFPIHYEFAKPQNEYSICYNDLRCVQHSVNFPGYKKEKEKGG